MEKTYDYDIQLQVVDYNFDEKLTRTTEYILPWQQQAQVSPSAIVQSLESDRLVAFQVTGIGDLEDSETNPVLMKVIGLMVGTDDENDFRVLVMGEIIMIDGIATSPPTKSPSVYDDLLELGFEPVAVETTLETGENGVYDGILREISGN